MGKLPPAVDSWQSGDATEADYFRCLGREVSGKSSKKSWWYEEFKEYIDK